MKAEELMIGDWVYNKHHKKNIKITPFDFFTHGHLPSGRQYFIGEPELVSGKDLEPIPLTPEILEKNGLNKCHEEGWSLFKYKDDDNKKMALYQIYWYKEEPFLEIASYTSDFGEFGRPGIKYVHELQHALRLCGITLNIKV